MYLNSHQKGFICGSRARHDEVVCGSRFALLKAVDDALLRLLVEWAPEIEAAAGMCTAEPEPARPDANLKWRRDQIANRKRKGSRGGRPRAFDALTYKHRNLAERCIGKLKQWRAIATRFDKPASRYLAGVTIASLMLWLRQAELSDTL
ncbi:hypothetical protein ACNF49_32815 [Actinomadura sp. ATCC 39365]